MGRIVSRLRTAYGLDRSDQRLIAEAVVALLVARLRSGLLPFRVLARQLGGILPPDPAPPVTTGPLSIGDGEAIRAVRWAIRMTAPAMPFRAVCLQQAIAARAMLGRRGIASVLHLGVDRPAGGALGAHAWLDAGGLPVTGYPVDSTLAEVGRFAGLPGGRSMRVRG